MTIFYLVSIFTIFILLYVFPDWSMSIGFLGLILNAIILLLSLSSVSIKHQFLGLGKKWEFVFGFILVACSTWAIFFYA